MSDGRPHGTLYTIEWLNKYTSPPNGAPVLLAEVFTLQRQPPAEFEQIPFSLGGGYGKCTRHVGPPSRQLPQSTLAKVRRKRLARRLSVRVPMFADFFMQQEIEKKPNYYNGITDAKIKQAQDEVLRREWRAYNDYLTRIDKVIIYADEPPECKERSEQLRAEMEAIRHKSVSVDTLGRQPCAS